MSIRNSNSNIEFDSRIASRLLSWKFIILIRYFKIRQIYRIRTLKHYDSVDDWWLLVNPRSTPHVKRVL